MGLHDEIKKMYMRKWYVLFLISLRRQTNLFNLLDIIYFLCFMDQKTLKIPKPMQYYLLYI